jgi:hypothetical protein
MTRILAINGAGVAPGMTTIWEASASASATGEAEDKV